ncbi:MAG: LacI family DNA-binding transcriptional regulator [Mycobacteriaceae bacterium]
MPRTPLPRRRATLASLAAELNVSRTTVSNAYNRPDQLSSELRERVLAAAKELGYPGPDPVARSLRTRKAGALGLLLDEALSYSFRDPAAVNFLTGLADACEATGQGLLILPAGVTQDQIQASNVVQRAGVDGFIIYSVSAQDPYLKAVIDRQLPMVVCDQPVELDAASRVGINDRGAMRELAEYVIGLGHKKIGIITMRLGHDCNEVFVSSERLLSSPFHVQRERIHGIQEAMQHAGLDIAEASIVESFAHLPESGASAAQRLISENPAITALMCTTDVLALGALDYVRSRGIYVPGQLTVTGFDGVPEAIRRGLTTVIQPLEEKGRRAGMLLQRMVESGIPSVELLETRLLRGRTSGPAV